MKLEFFQFSDIYVFNYNFLKHRQESELKFLEVAMFVTLNTS
jgi:hypothetical protein